MRPAAGPHPKLTLLVLGTGCAAYTLLQSLLFPVLPTLERVLHTSQANATWVLTTYLLSASVCTPVLGRLGDRYGKKRMLVVALGSLAAGSLLAALATSLPVMVAARAIQGIGGGVLPLAFGIVHEQLPEDEVAGGMGLISAICGIGSGLGIVLAGPIIALLDYHWLFWIPLIPTAAAAVTALVVIGDGRAERVGKLRPAAFALLSTWLIALLLAVSEGSQWGWSSPPIVVLLALAVIALPSWIAVEVRSPVPLIDMQMMRRKGVWTNNLATLLTGTCMYGSLTFVAEFVQTPPSAGYGFGASVTAAGLIIAPQPALVIAVGPIIGRLTARIGSQLVLVVGAVFCTASMLVVALAHDQVWELAVSMGLIGVGIGLLVAAQANVAVTTVPPEQTGVAAGMNANIRLIGGSIGAAVMGAVVTSVLQPSGLPAVAGYTSAFGLIAVLSLAGAAVALLIPAGRPMAVMLPEEEVVPPW